MVALPAAYAVTRPVDETVATDGVFDVHFATLVASRDEPSVNATVAVS
jgi:hypothetical protein